MEEDCGKDARPQTSYKAFWKSVYCSFWKISKHSKSFRRLEQLARLASGFP